MKQSKSDSYAAAGVDITAGYRAVEPELKTGYLVVIHPRPEILKAKSTDVERELRKGFARMGMFRTEKA